MSRQHPGRAIYRDITPAIMAVGCAKGGGDVRSGAFQEQKINYSEYQDDSDVYSQSLPELVFEE
jgi:hypothetical protein